MPPIPPTAPAMISVRRSLLSSRSASATNDPDPGLIGAVSPSHLAEPPEPRFIAEARRASGRRPVRGYRESKRNPNVQPTQSVVPAEVQRP